MGNKPHEEPVINVKFGPEDEVARQPPPPRRSFVELLVDPRTLHGLMLSGGGLLVVGLVVWLWSIGVFENPLVVAGCLGVGNAALLAAGIAAVRYSRYETAGKAVTLLACLVMPLNLWFYDAQSLVTLDQGGHLWVPALVCCAVYVLVARVLADAVFVHAIVGGITMSGMLLLADHQVERFWEIMSPSTFLVVLGIICIHVERAFAPGEGPFSREKFGRAFFHAGHVVMATGLVVLLVGRLAGWLYDPYFAELGWFAMPSVATQANLQLLALALALGGAYSYVYSQMVVEARGRYLASAVLTLLWSAIILADLVGLTQVEFIYATTLVGVVCLISAAVSNWRRDEPTGPATVTVTEWAARGCLSISGVATILLSLGKLLAGETGWAQFGLLISQIAATALAGLLARQAEWRRFFVVLTAAEVLMTLLVLNSLSMLTFGQRVEIFLTVGGLSMLAAGYVGWIRETDQPNELVSFNLAAGSLLAAVPIAIGLVLQRFGDNGADWGWVMLHEGGALVIGMGLLAAGVLCRIRWSTLTGAGTLAVYIVSLIGLVHLPDKLQTTAVYMMVGGGSSFGIAVLLSVYRDRLLALPKQVQEGEGVFSVLKWR